MINYQIETFNKKELEKKYEDIVYPLIDKKLSINIYDSYQIHSMPFKSTNISNEDSIYNLIFDIYNNISVDNYSITLFTNYINEEDNYIDEEGNIIYISEASFHSDLGTNFVKVTSEIYRNFNLEHYYKIFEKLGLQIIGISEPLENYTEQDGYINNFLVKITDKFKENSIKYLEEKIDLISYESYSKEKLQELIIKKLYDNNIKLGKKYKDIPLNIEDFDDIKVKQLNIVLLYMYLKGNIKIEKFLDIEQTNFIICISIDNNNEDIKSYDISESNELIIKGYENIKLEPMQVNILMNLKKYSYRIRLENIPKFINYEQMYSNIKKINRLLKEKNIINFKLKTKKAKYSDNTILFL